MYVLPTRLSVAQLAQMESAVLNEYWTITRHLNFPYSMLQNVWGVLLCAERSRSSHLPTSHLPTLPEEIWRLIFSFYKRGDWVRFTATHHYAPLV